MITECPSCQTRFRVSQAQLERAEGRVRCGACLSVFHGVENLVLAFADAMDPDGTEQALDDVLDELAAQSLPRDVSRDEKAPAPGLLEREDAASPEVPTRDAPPRQGSAPAASGQTPATPADAARAGESVSPAPEDAVAGPAAGSITFGDIEPSRPLVWVGIVAGILLLAAQVLWYQFDDWATQPRWRGVYSTICGIIGCELPVQRDASQLGTRNMVVRIHPEEPRALLVNAVIVNAAEFAQPYPVLELQFTTVRGNLVASRRYHPDEYLAGDAADMTLIPPRTPVQIELTIDDPGPDAVNYRLNFR